MNALPIPRLTASEAQALNAVASALHGLSVNTPGAPSGALLTISSLGPGIAPPGIADAILATLEWAGARFQLELPEQAVAVWAAQSLDAELAPLPPAWRDAALARGLDWLCESLSQLDRGRARCVSLTTARDNTDAPQHRLLMQLAWPLTGNSLCGILHSDGLGLLVCASLAANLSSTRRKPVDFSTLPFTLSLCLGETEIAARRLTDLGPGDVILVTQPFLDSQGAIMLRAVSASQILAIPAQLDGLQITITATPSAMTTPPDQTASLDADDTPVGLDQIPIRLSFDVGNTSLTFAELQALQPGSTLALDRPPREYVTIRANGAVIGTGHLVDIDGRLGISISTLSPPGPRG